MPLTKVQAGMVEATGTPSSSTFLRGDGAWASPLVSGTAVTASGTSVDFNSIPAGVRRITVMFNGVSTNGTSNILVQVGSGSVVNTGYVSNAANIPNGSTPVTSSATSGLLLTGANASTVVLSGSVVLTNITGNVWVYISIFGRSDAATPIFGGGNSPSLSGTLDRIRITTVNGTDTFDAGTINILYEA